MSVLVNFAHYLVGILVLLLAGLLILTFGGIVALGPLRRLSNTQMIGFPMLECQHISGQLTYLLIFVLVLQRILIHHNIFLEGLQNLLLIAASR